MKGYCTTCDEVRTDTFDDAWGFAIVASIPQCLRCGSIVELKENGQVDSADALSNDEDSELGLAG